MRDFTNLIRVAEKDEERLAIYRFRYEIYIEEMGKPYKNADHVNRLLTDELDDLATLLYFENEGEIHGTVRINWGKDDVAFAAFDNPNFRLSRFDRFASKAFSFNSRFMVSPQFRNSRLGLDLARRSYWLGLQHRVLFNFINCNPGLVEFFERLGFKKYESTFLDEMVGDQTPMVLFLEDVDHLRHVKSPFLERTRENRDPEIVFERLLVPVMV